MEARILAAMMPENEAVDLMKLMPAAGIPEGARLVHNRLLRNEMLANQNPGFDEAEDHESTKQGGKRNKGPRR